MDRERIKGILNDFKSSRLSENDALKALKNLPFEDISFAKIDHHRTLRWGFPEVIFCQGKSSEQVSAIAKIIIDQGSNLLATRATIEIYDEVLKTIPDAKFNEAGKTITCVKKNINKLMGIVTIITAGTSDIPVAAESLETAHMLGLDAKIIPDLGVAGIHRVIEYREELNSSSVIIVIAGMEGALPSVVAGLVPSPVIAVPTSIGYGTSLNGLTPLLGMLNSCVPGVAVMNIDNGFGAAFLAFRILSCNDKK